MTRLFVKQPGYTGSVNYFRFSYKGVSMEMFKRFWKKTISKSIDYNAIRRKTPGRLNTICVRHTYSNVETQIPPAKYQMPNATLLTPFSPLTEFANLAACLPVGLNRPEVDDLW